MFIEVVVVGHAVPIMVNVDHTEIVSNLATTKTKIAMVGGHSFTAYEKMDVVRENFQLR